MRFRDRPLLVDGLDAAVHLERPELEAAVIAPLLEGRNVLLLGEAGAGKSTLLRRTASLLERRNRAAVLVNAALADDAGELLDLVDAALEEHVGTAGRPDPAGASRQSTRLLSGVRRLRRDEPTTLLVDGLIDPDIAYDVFGRLRDELWELGHTWAVAVRPRDSAPLRTPPASAFWGAVVEIPPLDSDETKRLLRLGLDDHEYREVDRGRSIGGEHPRTVIRTAQAVLAGDGEPGAMSRGHELLHKAAELGRGEAMAMAELQGLGRPSSAHDPELLERLGWSRPYAQRILSHLEANGLLRSMPERSDQPGRPRKLYEPNPNPNSNPELK